MQKQALNGFSKSDKLEKVQKWMFSL